MPTVARKWQERPTAIIAESTLTMQKGRQASAAQEAKPPRTSKVIQVRLVISVGKKSSGVSQENLTSSFGTCTVTWFWFYTIH